MKESTKKKLKKGLLLGASALALVGAGKLAYDRFGPTRMSSRGKKFLQGLEGVKKDSKGNVVSYNDAYGNATSGYGVLLHKGGLTSKDKKAQSQSEAKKQFNNKLREYEDLVNKRLKNKWKLSRKQKDALISVTYNSPSTSKQIIDAINNGADKNTVSKMLTSTRYGNGLDKRRQAEANLYKSGKYDSKVYG